MKPLKQEDLKELTEKVYDLLNETKISIGQNTDGKTLAALSKIFAQDLIQERRFGNMTFNQIQDAFRLGVRFGDFEPFINIRTFYRWVYSHKKTIIRNDREELGQELMRMPGLESPEQEIFKRMHDINTFQCTTDNEIYLGGTDEYGKDFTICFDAFEFYRTGLILSK
jgi:hypothetical protein